MNEMQLGRKFGNGEMSIDSRKVAGMVGKKHAHVLRDVRTIISHLNENPKLDCAVYFKESYYLDVAGRERVCYELTKKGCELYATRMTGAEGTLFAAMFVEVFNEMEEELKPKLPTTYRDALAQLLYQVDENERLSLENEQMKPKAQFAEAVEISTNSVSVGHVAKIACKEGLNIGQNKLFAWLRDNGYLVKRPGATKNTPTQRSMDLGVMELVASTKEFNGEPKTFYTTKITGKGQVYFVNKLLKEYEQ